MLKKIVIAAAILIGFQAEAHAGFMWKNGVATNGINGVATNGMTFANGVGSNGIHLANGISQNGVPYTNGTGVNGIERRGLQLNSSGSDGHETYVVERHATTESSTVFAITLPVAR